MHYIIQRIKGLLFFFVSMAIIVVILSEVIFPMLNHSGVIQIPTKGRKGEMIGIVTSFAIYLLIYGAYIYYQTSQKSSSGKYNYSTWEPEGTEFWQIISERSPQSIAFLENLIGCEIKRLFSNPKVDEVKTNVKALIGIAHECPNKTNSSLVPMVTAVSKLGRVEFGRNENAEIFDTPVYFQMIEDYYRHCGLEKERFGWHAITKPKPPIEQWGVEGQPLWYIARLCINVVEGK